MASVVRPSLTSRDGVITVFAAAGTPTPYDQWVAINGRSRARTWFISAFLAFVIAGGGTYELQNRTRSVVTWFVAGLLAVVWLAGLAMLVRAIGSALAPVLARVAVSTVRLLRRTSDRPSGQPGDGPGPALETSTVEDAQRQAVGAHPEMDPELIAAVASAAAVAVQAVLTDPVVIARFARAINGPPWKRIAAWTVTLAAGGVVTLVIGLNVPAPAAHASVQAPRVTTTSTPTAHSHT